MLEKLRVVIKAAERMWWLWPVIAMVVTFVLIMTLSAGQSVWFDEGYSILLAKRPVAELVALTGVDAHPPLYYLILKGWAEVFGWSEYALRSLSAVFSSLTVGVVFLLIRRLFTVRTALVTLPLLVFAPFALRYGYEIRMYALAAFIGALATLVLSYAYTSKSKKAWIPYAVLVALGMYTLYMTAALWIAHLVWLCIVKKPKLNWQLFKQPFVLAYVGAFALFLVYMPTFIHQLLHSALPGIGNPVNITKLGDITSMTLSFTPEWKVSGPLALAILAILYLTVYLLLFARRKLTRSQRPSLYLLGSLVLVPIAFFALSSLPHPIFVNRYVAHVAIFSYALIGVTIALGWRYGKRISASILMVLSLIVLGIGTVQLQQVGNYIYERLQYPRTTEIRASVHCDNNTTVVADDPYTYIDSRYYFSDCDLRFFSEEDVNNEGGYAPLHGSNKRISSADEVNSSKIVHLHWQGATSLFNPTSDYKLVDSREYDKQVVDIYTRM
jgi:uncharacterized membrane protein